MSLSKCVCVLKLEVEKPLCNVERISLDGPTFDFFFERRFTVRILIPSNENDSLSRERSLEKNNHVRRDARKSPNRLSVRRVLKFEYRR